MDTSQRKQLRNISWDELEKHNKGNDCWMVIRGKVYDVTSWISKHPGGDDPLLLNAGKDATILFESYHPVKTNEILKKYVIGEIKYDANHPSFPPMSDFYLKMREKVDGYFTKNKIDPKFSLELLFRIFVFVISTFAFYFLSIKSAVNGNYLFACFYSILSGVAAAVTANHALHEGSHFSLTHIPIVWKLLGATLDFLLGVSYYQWLNSHFLGHHPYTNLITNDKKIDSLDPDVFTNDPDMRRIKPSQSYYTHYKLQWIYMPLLYSFLAAKYRTADIVITFSTRMNGGIKVNELSLYHWCMFLGGKVFFLFYRFAIPMYFLGFWQILFLSTISDMTTGFYLACSFQVSHVVPQAKWPRMDKETGAVNMDWAQMQLATTVDYAHNNYLTTLLVGALNYQVVHHLFPYICQVHYKDIAPIVIEHCKQYGVKYHVLPNFTEAFKNHLHYLSIMGVPDLDL